MKLRDIAHTRTGDKGDTSNLVVVAYRPEHFERLRQALTVQRVAAHYQDLFYLEGKAIEIQVIRYEVVSIHALNFVMKGLLRGGVTRSLSLDPHGKTLASSILDLDLNV